MILFQTATSLTALSIVRERERGTIEQLIVTPIRSWELILAKIIPYIIVSFMDMLLILLIGTLWFHVPIRGSLWLLFAMTALYLLPTLGLGLLISTFAKTQQQAQLMTHADPAAGHDALRLYLPGCLAAGLPCSSSAKYSRSPISYTCCAVLS